MTYTLKEDITGADGKVIYPKGYQYNPMEYMFMRRIIVSSTAGMKSRFNGTNNRLIRLI